MSDIINLACPSCGGKLIVENGKDRSICSYCKNEYIVKGEGGNLSLSPAVKDISKIRIGVDKTASELAIKRLGEEIAALNVQRDALAGPSSGTLGCAVLLLLSGLIFTGIYAILGFDWFGCTIIAIIGVVVVALFAAFSNQRKKYEAQAGTINDAIAQKMKELEEHHSVVSIN